VSGVSARSIDDVLHAERLDRRAKRLHPLRTPVLRLPDGAMVAEGDRGYLIREGQAWLWSFAGYKRSSTDLQNAKLLTPPSTLRAFRAGYRPVFDPGAFKLN